MASSDKMARAVFNVDTARALKVRRVSKRESKVTFDDLGKELPSTSSRDFSVQLSVKVVEEDPNPNPLTLTLTLTLTLNPLNLTLTLTLTLTRSRSQWRGRSTHWP